MNDAKQIAEKLARKCSISLYGEDNVLLVSDSHKILQSIPLVEFMECGQSAQHFRNVMDEYPQGTSPYANAFVRLDTSIERLNLKLKQLLGEEI